MCLGAGADKWAGPLLSLKCRGAGQVPHPAPERPGSPPATGRGNLPGLSFSWIWEPPGIGLVGFFPQSVPREGSRDPGPCPPLAPKTTSPTRNRIIPLPWRWGGVAASFSLACAGYSWDPPPGPLPSTTARALCQVPAGFSRLPPRCSWVWLGWGEAMKATQPSPASCRPSRAYCVSRGGGRELAKAPPPPHGHWRVEGVPADFSDPRLPAGAGRWTGHHCLSFPILEVLAPQSSRGKGCLPRRSMHGHVSPWTFSFRTACSDCSPCDPPPPTPSRPWASQGLVCQSRYPQGPKSRVGRVGLPCAAQA